MGILRYLKDCKQKIDKSEYFMMIKWKMGFFLVLGYALTCLADKIGFSSLSHLGTALMIASIIGFFLEITEIKDFFGKRLVDILFEDAYIGSINEERLIKLNSETLKGIGKIKINNPEYEIDDFVKKIQANVLENIGKIYRKDFQEIIHYSILTNGEIQELGLNPDELKNRRLVRTITTIKFRLIAPNEEEQTFDLDCVYEPILIPGLDPSKQMISFDLRIDDDKVPIDISEYIKPNERNLSFNLIHPVSFKSTASFTASIEYKRESYEYHDLSGRIKTSMNTLTHGANIHFASREVLEVGAEFYGVTNYKESVPTPNSISIDYSDWALPEAGYFIYWKEINRKS